MITEELYYEDGVLVEADIVELSQECPNYTEFSADGTYSNKYFDENCNPEIDEEGDDTDVFDWEIKGDKIDLGSDDEEEYYISVLTDSEMMITASEIYEGVEEKIEYRLERLEE